MVSTNKSSSEDPIADKLRSYAHYVLVAVFGLLPLFFVPSSAVPFEFSKVFFALLGVVFALILLS